MMVQAQQTFCHHEQFFLPAENAYFSVLLLASSVALSY
jgi:hypothetical protein